MVTVLPLFWSKLACRCLLEFFSSLRMRRGAAEWAVHGWLGRPRLINLPSREFPWRRTPFRVAPKRFRFDRHRGAGLESCANHGYPGFRGASSRLCPEWRTFREDCAPRTSVDLLLDNVQQPGDGQRFEWERDVEH